MLLKPSSGGFHAYVYIVDNYRLKKSLMTGTLNFFYPEGTPYNEDTPS